MTQAKTGDTVKVHYTGKLDDGTIFDTSADREPLEFTIGNGQLIPDFEQAVIGMNPDEFVSLEDGMANTINYFHKYLAGEV